VVAAAGTVVTMPFAVQLVGVAGAPLKVTVLDPWDAPKFEPVIVTEVPTGPAPGETAVMTGDNSATLTTVGAVVVTVQPGLVVTR
jgi:hypothetical protein